MTYGYKTLKEFKAEYIKEAEQSIIVPEYSTNKGFDSKVAALMKDHFKSDPTKMFIKMNGYLRSVVRDDWEKPFEYGISSFAGGRRRYTGISAETEEQWSSG